MIENQQHRYDEKNAAKMGISVTELHACEFEYDEDTTNDGIVTGTYIKFDRDNSPKEVLEKLSLDSMDRFEIFNDENDYQEGEN